MNLAIRPATSADIPAMSAVLIASITELCVPDHGGAPHAIAAWTRNKTEDGVAAMLANPQQDFYVAECDGAVLAVGAVSQAGEIKLNYVAPRARFSGVSKAMLAHLEGALVAMGHWEGRLESTRTARAFYLSQGWQADGPQASGRVVNGYPMRKLLLGEGR